MSLQDSLFSEDVEEDLQHFLKNDKRKRVLVFPPVNNYRRFLIHQLVQDRFANLLQTFSIGQSFARRTVVCYKSDFIGLPQVNGVSSPTSDSVTGKVSRKMGIESQCTPSSSPEHSAHKPRQVKSVPAVEIYRPPAARRARLEKSPAGPPPVDHSSSDNCARANRQKRPDRAVYVPRHRRSTTDVENPQEAQCKSPKEVSRANSKPPIDRVASDQTITKEMPTAPLRVSSIEKLEEQTITKEMPEPVVPVIENAKEQVIAKDSPMPTVATVEKMETHVDSKETSTTNEDSSLEKMEVQVYHESVAPVTNESTVERMEAEEIQPNVDSELDSFPVERLKEKKDDEHEESHNCVEESDKRDRRKSEEIDEDGCSASEIQINPSTAVTESCNFNDLCNNETGPQSISSREQQKVEDASRDKSDEKIIEQPLVSKVLIISSNENEKETKSTTKPIEPVIPMTPPEKKVKKVVRPKSKPAPPPLPPSKINRDECDWDSLFDDNGDCLDPTLIEELTSSVGEVVIEKPKSSYRTYTRPVEVSSDEFGHVLEIYNFPSDFKSSDLAAVFSPFKSGGFELKWVDDTHCLGVFSSPLVAAEVLASDHPFVKTRPLSEATTLSKTKARRSSEFLQPYRTRPETCAALARRLVTKSLGVKLATARQEREQEKIVLREAKEKKRLANKQREDVWEGIIAEKPTS